LSGMRTTQCFSFSRSACSACTTVSAGVDEKFDWESISVNWSSRLIRREKGCRNDRIDGERVVRAVSGVGCADDRVDLEAKRLSEGMRAEPET
jgi:hypothetical protein